MMRVALTLQPLYVYTFISATVTDRREMGSPLLAVGRCTSSTWQRRERGKREEEEVARGK